MSVPDNIRVDLQHVADLVTPKARLLYVGCGDGALLAYLKKVKQVDRRGLELAMSKVRAAVGHGVPVVQGNLETEMCIERVHFRFFVRKPLALAPKPSLLLSEVSFNVSASTP